MDVLITIGFVLFIVITWILQDTITECLSKGKSFAPNELKGF